MRGRPTLPTEQKKRRGTYRRDQDNGGGIQAEIVPLEPPAPDRGPLEVYDEVLEHAKPWLAASDGTAVALLRGQLQLLGQVAKNIQDLQDRCGQDPVMLLAALPMIDRHYKTQLGLQKSILELLVQLGFTPAARSRLGLAQVKAETKMDQIRAAREERLSKMQGRG